MTTLLSSTSKTSSSRAKSPRGNAMPERAKSNTSFEGITLNGDFGEAVAKVGATGKLVAITVYAC